MKGLSEITEGPILICNDIQNSIGMLSWCRNRGDVIRLMYVLEFEDRFGKSTREVSGVPEVQLR